MQPPIHVLLSFTLSSKLDRFIVLPLDVLEMAGVIDLTFLQLQHGQRICYFWYRVRKSVYRRCGQV